jgi:hypothetical protein
MELNVVAKRVRKSRPKTNFEDELISKLSQLRKPGSSPGEPYAERSIQGWVRNIYTLFKQLYPSQEPTDLLWLNDHQTVRDNVFVSYEKLNTRQANYNSIIMVYRPEFLTTDYKQEVLDMYLLARNDIGMALKQKQQPNENQKEVLSDEHTKKDIFSLLDELVKSSVVEGDIVNRQDYMLYMILLIHTQYPFRNDLASMRVIKESSYKALDETQKKNMNFIVIGKKSLYFIRDDYKMKASYGTLRNDIPDKKLRKVIKLWFHDGLKLYEDKHKLDFTYFISQDNGSPISRNNLSQILAKQTESRLGKRISTTLLAKIFDLSPKVVETATIEQMKQVKKQASVRGHGVGVRLSTYKNPNNQ